MWAVCHTVTGLPPIFFKYIFTNNVTNYAENMQNRNAWCISYHYFVLEHRIDMFRIMIAPHKQHFLFIYYRNRLHIASNNYKITCLVLWFYHCMLGTRCQLSAWMVSALICLLKQTHYVFYINLGPVYFVVCYEFLCTDIIQSMFFCVCNGH